MDVINIRTFHRFITIHLVVVFLFLIIPCGVFSQLSPGKLTKAHSSLEGLSNCTLCHDLGAKISEKKCLSCHTHLQQKITQNKGYHVSKDIKGKACISCHSEHHGVNFEMVRFDKKTFNHNLTGYELKGAHKKIDCTQCHSPENISDPVLKKNKKTYLGLTTTCTSCHEDYHQKTLSNQCSNCHGMESFKPASGFDHSNTGFPLTGGHKGVSCTECHKTETKNNKKFQHFADVPFKNCNSCHKDPHNGSFGKDCKSCHSVESFHKIKASSAFNHSVTGFELEGKHRTLDCKKCHDNRPGTVDLYKEFAAVKEVKCLTCHEDSHNNKFGENCTSCHSQNSFAIKGNKKDFNHELTGYSLTGRHKEVDCRKCHTETYMTAPLAHNECKKCHSDYHKGDFAGLAENDCKVCHSTDGFAGSSFDFERHEKSTFPLRGAHLATPCTACHKKDGQNWKFREIGKSCIQCHDNIHKGFISEKYMPENNCALCHGNENWGSVTFDHNNTTFQLIGKHLRTECRSCHFEIREGKTYQQFSNLDTKCASCHDNVHGNQFEESGITDCKRCHGFERWDRSNFNHDNTRFKLEGAHLNVNCNECHKAEVVDGKSTIIYKIGKLTCADCHQ